MTTANPPRDDAFNTPLPTRHDESHPALFAEGWTTFAREPDQAPFDLVFTDRLSLEFKLS